ncbi:MAG: VIT domain-containing protein [Betaproteobacteria bacterium]|jgi:Ca-activated chloride channel family protein
MFESSGDGFLLKAISGDGEPVLQGVQVRGRLEGLLFSVTLRQAYRNLSHRTLEVVYTFPLPIDAVVLGMAAEIGQTRLEAKVLPRAQAETLYETALEEGDLPMMLEAGGGGMYTANLGNLKVDEEVVLELRFAQLVKFDQGRLRLSVPMTVAPRYGNVSSSGLAPHQVPEVHLYADYPLDFSVEIAGELADAKLECPTHPSVQARHEGCRVLTLDESTRLDRDVVVLVEPSRTASICLLAPDDYGNPSARTQVAVAAFELPERRDTGASEEQGIRLKLLVDCSGSMAGDSMASAKRALMGMLKALGSLDDASYSRFGDTLEVDVRSVRCDRRGLQALSAAVSDTGANLGGTAMEAALLGTLSLAPLGRTGLSSDLLLITDGEVWDTQAVMAVAQKKAHRVFVLGVGSSPAYDLLSRLAQATGGACEFATPGENLEAAALRMVQRMRQRVWSALSVDWGRAQAPLWEVPVASQAFAGDTVLAMAGFADDSAADASAADAPRPSARLWHGVGESRRLLSEAAGTVVVEGGMGNDLSRVLGASRWAQAQGSPMSHSEGEAQRLAMAYQLVSPHTHCVLVHTRIESEKPVDEAQLHRVRSMLAAGWGGTGSVLRACVSHSIDARGVAGSSTGLTSPSLWRTARTVVKPPQPHPWADIEIPAYLRRASLTEPPAELELEWAPPTGVFATLRQTAQALDDHLCAGGEPPFAAVIARLAVHPRVQAAVAALGAAVPNEASRWYLLHFWLFFGSKLDRHGVMQGGANRWGIPLETMEEAMETLSEHLKGADLDSWGDQRQSRLQRALSKVGFKTPMPLQTRGWEPFAACVDEIEIPSFLKRQAD